MEQYAVDYSELPKHLIPGMKRYIEERIPTGDFLRAVMENDLLVATKCADEINRGRLYAIVSWLYNQAPSRCWGSPKKVQAWLERKTLED